MGPVWSNLSDLTCYFFSLTILVAFTCLLFWAMHPQRPLPQAMPSSTLGQHLRDMAMGLGRGKNFLGGNFAYSFIQSVKECLYFLLCCWCIKEILDWDRERIDQVYKHWFFFSPFSALAPIAFSQPAFISSGMECLIGGAKHWQVWVLSHMTANYH